jgi:hypothetical protein
MARKKRQKPPQPDLRQPVYLNEKGGAYNLIDQLVKQAMTQVAQSDVVRAALAAYCDGRGLEGDWELRTEGFNLGKLSLVPAKPKPTPPVKLESPVPGG